MPHDDRGKNKNMGNKAKDFFMPTIMDRRVVLGNRKPTSKTPLEKVAGKKKNKAETQTDFPFHENAMKTMEKFARPKIFFIPYKSRFDRRKA